MDTSEAVIEDKPEETEDIDLSSESDIEESDEEDLRLTEEEAKRRQNEKKEKVKEPSSVTTDFRNTTT